MQTLEDVRDKLDHERVLELLSYAVFPDPEQVNQAAEAYRVDPDLALWGCSADGEWVGIIGIRKAAGDERRIAITHLAVHPEVRGKGYGRGMILELIVQERPSVITAETDDEAVDFYRSIGFEVVSLGEKYPGVERYACTYIV